MDKVQTHDSVITQYMVNENPGFKINRSIILKLISGLIFGDVMMQLYNETIPYEVNKGETHTVYKELEQKISNYF